MGNRLPRASSACTRQGLCLHALFARTKSKFDGGPIDLQMLIELSKDNNDANRTKFDPSNGCEIELPGRHPSTP